MNRRKFLMSSCAAAALLPVAAIIQPEINGLAHLEVVRVEVWEGVKWIATHSHMIINDGLIEVELE